MTIKRYGSLAGSEFEEEADGYWVTFEDHERMVARLSKDEPHWLVKDFNVLYRAAKAFSDVCAGLGDGKPYVPHKELQAQLERLAPAFNDTEEVRRLLRERG